MVDGIKCKICGKEAIDYDVVTHGGAGDYWGHCAEHHNEVYALIIAENKRRSLYYAVNSLRTQAEVLITQATVMKNNADALIKQINELTFK